MKKFSVFFFTVFLACTFILLPPDADARRRRFRQQKDKPAPAVGGIEKTISVDGLTRNILVFPAKTPLPESGSPVIFAFHGHGGNRRGFAGAARMHELWPEATVLYLQGIPGIPGKTDPTGVKNGWQKSVGEANDRDIKLFDATLAQLQSQIKVDSKRIYVMGFSNGGQFSNILWDQRGNKIAAIASAGGHGGLLTKDNVPRSAYLIIGEQDRVAPADQQKRNIPLLRKLLQTDPSKAKKNGYETLEPGANGNELAFYIYPGPHEWPQAVSPLVVAFFKRHALP